MLTLAVVRRQLLGAVVNITGTKNESQVKQYKARKVFHPGDQKAIGSYSNLVNCGNVIPHKSHRYALKFTYISTVVILTSDPEH